MRRIMLVLLGYLLQPKLTFRYTYNTYRMTYQVSGTLVSICMCAQQQQVKRRVQ